MAQREALAPGHELRHNSSVVSVVKMRSILLAPDALQLSNRVAHLWRCVYLPWCEPYHAAFVIFRGIRGCLLRAG